MNDITIEKAILHILDTSITTPVLADKLMAYSLQADEFLQIHIARAIEDADIKKGGFKAEGEDIKKLLSQVEDVDFIQGSQQLAQQIFDIAISNPAIPAADLLCCLFKYDNGLYFGLLKFNYKSSYIHQFNMTDDYKETRILKQNATIASENQKLEEFAFIRLDDFSVLVKEKKYEINGAKEYYLSSQILKITTDLSPKTKVNIVEKAAQKVIKEFYGEDPLKISQVKTELKSCVDENSIIEIDRITNAVFDGNFSAQQRYREEVAQKGISGRAFEVTSEIEKTVARKQKICTDSGIEISLPVDYLENKKKVEFIMNEDGTMSILIKAVVLR